MRPIDADALNERIKELAAEAKRDKEYGRMQGLYYAKDEVREAPTVEAITLDWLNRKYVENDPDGSNEYYDWYLRESISYVLTVWKEDQEENE